MKLRVRVRPKQYSMYCVTSYPLLLSTVNLYLLSILYDIMLYPRFDICNLISD